MSVSAACFESPTDRTPAPRGTRQPDPWIGRQLGKYQICARLGQGGMGVVYRAVDRQHHRQVAVKLLPAELSGEPLFRKRFSREVKAISRLGHPNIVAVLDAGRWEGTYYLVMELVPGGSAHGLLREHGPFSWQVATWIAAQACRGLVAAHAAGLVHRDVKPANILLGPNSEVKLADFGLAKSGGQSASSLTETGGVLGTPHYMSPEQCRAEQADDCSDIYSLGATYFTLLTGQPPYPLDAPVQVMFAHCSRPIPDPRLINPAIPEACVRVLNQAMAKRRDLRHPSANALLSDLEGLLADTEPMSTPRFPSQPQAGEPIPDPSATTALRSVRKKQLRWALVAGVAAFLVLPVLIGAIFLRSGDEQPNSAAPSGRQRWDALAARTAHVRCSTDAQVMLAELFAFRETLEDPAEMDGMIGLEAERLRCLVLFSDAKSGAGVLFPTGGSVSGLAWSADHRWLAASCSDGEGGVRLWDATTKHASQTRWAGGRGALPIYSIAFSPDGRTLAAATRGQVRLWRPRDGKETVLSVAGPKDLVGPITYSPCGTLLAVRVEGQANKGPRTTVAVWNPSTGKRAYQLPANAGHAYSVAFGKANANTLATVGMDGLVHLWAADTGEWRRDLPTGFSSAHSLAFSPDGKSLVVAGYYRDTKDEKRVGLQHWSIADGTRRGPELVPTPLVRSVAFAPNGLVASANVSQVALWSPSDWQQLAVLGDTASKQHTHGLAFSSAGGILAGAVAPAGVRLWDIRRFRTNGEGVL